MATLVSEMEALKAENEALRKTRDALMARLDQNMVNTVSPFRLFETNLTLTQELQTRTDELEEQRERLRLAMLGAFDGFWDYDPSSGQVWYSDRFVQLLGLEPGDDEAFPPHLESFTARLHADDRQATLDAIEAHLTGQAPYDITYRLWVERQGFRWFRARGQAHWNADGVATRMAGSIQDITAQREAEEELRQSETFLRTVLDGQMAQIAIVDGRGTIVSTNAAWTLFWSEVDGLLECSIGMDYLAVCQRGAELETESGHADAVGRVLSGSSRHESVTYCCGARKRWFQVSIASVGGDQIGAVIAHYDVTPEIEARQALAEASETNQLLALVAEHTDNAAIVTDRNARIEWVNPGFTRITGHTLDEVRGRVPGSFLQGPETDPATVQKMREGIRSGRGFDVEVENYSKSGERYWLAVEVRPIHNADGEVERFMAIERDITAERQRGERLLMLEAAVENASEAMLTIAQDGSIVDVNAETCRRLGYDQDELRQLKIWDVDADASEAGWERFWGAVAVSGKQRIATLHRDRHGQDRPVDVSHTSVRKGGTDYLCAFARDISQEVEIRHQLDEERSLLRDILSTIPYLVFWKDEKLRYLGCNRHYAESVGLESTEAIVGKTDADLSWSDEQVEKFKAADREILEGGEPKLHVVEVHPGRDGIPRTFDTSRVPLREDGGDICGVIAVYADITEQTMLERQLQQAQKLESIGQLAAGIAHEINTPTQYVGDNTRFLQEGVSDLFRLLDAYAQVAEGVKSAAQVSAPVAEARRIADEIDLDFLREELPASISQSLEGIGRVSEIVRAMKEFSHPGGKRKQMIDLNRAIGSTVTVCRNRWKYVAELEMDLDGDLPQVSCLVGEFNQVMLNLIVNAADAIAERFPDARSGKIRVSTQRRGDKVEIRVCDNGGGIPEELRKRVFDPFFTTKAVGKGTGQGLAISHDVVVNKHGGSIEFECEAGEGTTFILQIPFSEEG